MKIFEKIKIKLRKGKSKQIRILGIPVFQYDNIAGKHHYYFPFVRNKSQNVDNKPVFYLKVNLETSYSYLCLQYWLNIIERVNGDFYIICDKPQLEVQILKSNTFTNSHIKFIRSIKRPLNQIVKNVAMPRWYNAAYAHLTTFYHAQSHNINSFWNIDADDTMLVAPFEKSAEIIKKVVMYAERNQIDIMSLDMWHSRTRGEYWTFGITYTNNASKVISCFNNSNELWKKNYINKDQSLNIDWFVTYLLDCKKINASTFYVDNLYFIHWSYDCFLQKIFSSYICYWENNKLIFPIISEVFKNNELGIIPIAKDCVKIDIPLTSSECLSFAMNFITHYNHLAPALKNLWHI